MKRQAFASRLKCLTLALVAGAIVAAQAPPQPSGEDLTNPKPAPFARPEPAAFPYQLPATKPDRPLSVAMERLYSDYPAPTPEANELHSTFKFTPLAGFDYQNGDGTITRRDPSKVIRLQGLATADDPLGPFTKHPLNPVTNSGHETTLFPFQGGMAELVVHNGIEHNTIQYAPDGISFKVASVSSLMPVAAGPYVPDAFTDPHDGCGITWGLCHITDVGTRTNRHSILARFDCDLSQDVNDPWMKQTDRYLKPEAYFSQGLGQQQREQREKAVRQPAAK